MHRRAGRPYLHLVRPANVTTALADVLAGYAVAGGDAPAALPFLLVSTACLYAGGIVLNDVFDRDVDRVERPERPIPSGRISVRAAARLGGGLLGAGVVTGWLATPAAGAVAAAIAALVLLYDAVSKRHAIAGPVNMAACRALNLLLGVAAVPPMLYESWFVATVPLLYVWAVTTVSRGEVHGGSRIAVAAALGALTLALSTLTALALRAGALRGAALVLTGFLAWRVLPPFWQAWTAPTPGAIRMAVRRGVLSLVLVDAAIAAAYGSAGLSAAILGTGVLAALLARRFAVT